MEEKRKNLEDIKKRLSKSLNPLQYFYFLTIPKNHPDVGKDVPIDYLLKNIVLYFWDKDFITLGLDQGSDLYPDTFINFDKKLTNGDCSLEHMIILLYNIFGRKSIKIYQKKIKYIKNHEKRLKMVK